jgi:peptide/nickel transport system substrate-binding protein
MRDRRCRRDPWLDCLDRQPGRGLRWAHRYRIPSGPYPTQAMAHTVPRPRRRIPGRALVPALALAQVATGCGPAEQAGPDVSTVTVLYPTDERGLGPEYDSPAQFLTFLPLVARNEDGELEPRLAESWEPSSDYRTWTVHLRTDVRWHDGMPVTAHDVAFSVRLLSRPDVGYMAPDEVSISVLDDSTLTWASSTTSPLSDYRTYYPKHLLEALDPTRFYEWEFWTAPVGNGPYRYVRHVPKTMMQLEVNPDYPLGTPQVERVVLKFGQESLPELLSGNVDVAADVNPMELLKLDGDPRFRRYDLRTPRVTALHWNHRHDLFHDTAVRRALTMAIDRSELLGVLNLPRDLPLFDVVFSERQWDSLPAPLPFDPDRARDLLGQVGWLDRDGDRILERDGVPFRFVVLVTGDVEREAVYVQDQLGRVGVRMDIERLSDWAQVFRRVRTGDFEGAISPLLMELTSPLGQLGFFGEDSYIGYANPRAHELLRMAANTGDPAVLDRIYLRLMDVFQADVPVTLLHPVPSTHVATTRLVGLSSPYRADPVWYMEHLRLEDRE